MKLPSIFAAFALTLGITGTYAEDVAPPVLIEATHSVVPGRIIDIRGLVPGMTPAEVRPILADILGAPPHESMEKTVLSGAGTMVTGTPYTRSMSSHIDDEKIEAFFSGVSSGNQLYLVHREVDFRRSRSDAPLFDDFVAALVAKHGTPSFRKDGASVTHIMWTYKDGQVAPCDPDGTPQCLQPDSAITYLPEIAQTYDVVIYAAVARERGDERVALMKMSSADLVLKNAADQADRAGLRPALDAAIAAEAANAPKPIL